MMNELDAKDYTIRELMAAFIANDLEDEVGVLVGANLPVPRAGVLLAHLTHGPNLRIIISFTRTNLIKEPILEPCEFITDWRASRWAESYYIHSDFIDYIKRYGMSEVFFIGGLQIDKYGNTNLIGIGENYKQLKFRGPGGVGTGDKGAHCKHYYIYANSHTRRSFVDRCDFVTAFGWGEGGKDARKKLGIPGGGPRYVVTPLCIMDFEEETKRMRLKSTHPGVKLQDVIDNTGFELIVPDKVPSTQPPTVKQLRILRNRIDVEGVLRP
jgi:glutaconate CoA-transferase subunit B